MPPFRLPRRSGCLTVPCTGIMAASASQICGILQNVPDFREVPDVGASPHGHFSLGMAVNGSP